MHQTDKLNTLAAEIAANIEVMEERLKEEYKRLIRISPAFDDILVEFIRLERSAMSMDEKDARAEELADRLYDRLAGHFGPQRDSALILDAALAVMDEGALAASRTPI